MRRIAVLVALLGGCVESSAVVCGGGLICPPDGLCDDVHHACTTQALLDACAAADDGTSCTVAKQDDGVCDQHICVLQTCGDGYRLNGEACDGTEFGAINNCRQLGYYDDVPLACTDTCDINRTVCTGFCGDGKVTAPQELCDGDLPTTSCVDLGYGAGQLQCNNNCGPDFARCVMFGWQHIAMPHYVQSVHALSRTNVWVSGDGPMVRHFDGTSWTDLDVSACTTDSVAQVFAVSATEAWLLLSDGVGFLTSSGCTKYASTAGFSRLWAPSATELWAGADGGLWHLQAGTWSQVDALPTQGIWGSGATDVYATTDDTSDSSVIGKVRHFDGGSWSTPTSTGLPDLYAIWGSPTGDVYISGDDPAVGPVVMHKTGSTWTTVLNGTPLATTSSIAFGGTTAGGRSYVEIVDFGAGTVFTLSSIGGDWSNTGGPFEGLSLSGAADGSVFAAASGRDHIFDLDGGAAYDLPPDPHQYETIAALSENVAAAIVAPTKLFAGAELWTWNGTSWTTTSTNVIQVFSSPGHVFAAYSSGVHELQADGQWSASFLTLSSGNYYFAGSSNMDLHFSLNGAWYHYNGSTSTPVTMPFLPRVVWAGSTTLAFAGGQGGHLARWNGAAWSEIPSPVTVDISVLWGRNTSEIYAASSNQLLTYDGTSWSLFPTQPTVNVINGIWSTGPQDIFIATDVGVSRWDGQHWTPVATGSPLGVYALSGAGDSLFIGSLASMRFLTRTRPW